MTTSPTVGTVHVTETGIDLQPDHSTSDSSPVIATSMTCSKNMPNS